MLLHGLLRTLTGKSKYLLVKCKPIQPIWIIMYILTSQRIAQAANIGENKAVFSKPCAEIMTLSTPVPELSQFALCTYIKLESSDPWTAFTYKLLSSPGNGYELGLLGDSSSIKIWMFGTPINILKSLSLHTWYEMCIKWSSQTENMSFYIDGALEVERKLQNVTKLQGGGNVILGCSNFEELNSTVSVGLVGELYMFRMWRTDDVRFLQTCIDGNVIKWDIGNWIYIPHVVQQDSTLHCAKQQAGTATIGQINNYIHMFHKRAADAQGILSSSKATAQSPSISGSVPEVNSTSISNVLSTTPDATNVTDMSSTFTPVNTYVTTDFKDSTTVSDALNSSMTTVNSYTTTDYKNTTTGNMSCVYNASIKVQTLYDDICNSNFSCSGTVFEIILQGNCTIGINEFIARKSFQDYQMHYKYLPDGCSVLINNSTIICFVEQYFPTFNLSIQEKNKIDYCCCEECRQSNCFNNGTFSCSGSTGITKGQTTTGYNTNIASTINKNTNNALTTITRNITLTTVNSQPSSTIKNEGDTTVWQSVSMTSSDSNETIKSGTTLIINSNSKTTVNSEFTTSFNRTSSTKVSSVPTTSLSTGSNTPNNKTDFTTFVTTFPEFSTSSSTTNQSAALDKVVSDLEDKLSGEVNVSDAEGIVGILNSILNTPQTFTADVSARLIKIVDKIGLKLKFSGQSVNLTSQYLALAVNKVNSSAFTETSFGIESSSGLQVTLDSKPPENSAGSVLLPASLLNDLSSADKDIASRVQFNYFAKTSFFVDSSLTGNQYLVSNVISSSVANLTITNLMQNVTVTLRTSPHNNSGILRCVFWDFTKNSGKGGWSSEGCTVNNATQNNNNQTICKCNHLTSFAILLDMTPYNSVKPEDALILTFITYIGCGLSAIFLSVTLITYIAFEKIRRDYPSKILIQLCAALIGLNLTFLMNPWIALYSEIPGLCISVAAFLHYFLMVSITWMGLEAFHMYLSLVKVFNTYVRKYILKFCIIGWGAPAVVVAIILAVNKDLYELQISQPYPNGAADYFCWMKDIIYWITVVGYFCIVFLLNVSMFVVVLIQLCRIKKQKQLGYQRKTLLQDIRSVAGITFLLGITWGLGFFSFGPGKVAIQYLFTIFNSLQGFFIFFFYCVAKENVRKQWRRYLCCGKFKLAENSDWSKTATNKLKKQTSKQGVSSSSSNSIQSTGNSNSTTLLVSNEYLMHPNGNGNVFKERNGVTFMTQNGEVQMQEIPGRPPTRNGDTQRTSLRRTSNRGSVHFVDQI